MSRACLLCLWLSFALDAASLTGVVLDAHRRPIVGAQVVLEGPTEVAAVTDSDGRFRFDSLMPGDYSASASSAGFQPSAGSPVKLMGDAGVARLELILDVESVKSAVVVYEVPERTAGSKLDIPLGELPVTVATASAETIRQQGNYDLVSALRYTANTQSRVNFGVYEHYTVRGFGDVIQMIDGIRQEDRRFNTQLVNVEQVEVLKGPAAALYGNNAVGGSLNVIRKKPRNEPSLEVGLTGGTWDNRRGHLGAAGPLVKDRLMYRFDYGFTDFHGYRGAPVRQHLVSPAILWRPTARDQLHVNYQYNNDRFATDSGFPTFANAIPRIPTNRRFNTPQDRALTADHFLQTYYHRQWTDNFELRNVFSYRNFTDDYLSTESISLTPSSTVNRTFFYFDRRRKTILNQVEAMGRFSTGSIRHYVLAGYDYQRFEQQDDSSNLTNLRATPIDLFAPMETQGPVTNIKNRTRFIDQSVHAAQVQDQIRFTDKLSATLNLRYDPWRRRFRTDTLSPAATGATTSLSQNAVTGRAGAVYRLRSGLSAYGSFGTAFTPVLSVPIDGSILEPEKSRQGEGGLRLDLFQRRVVATAAYFHLEKYNQTIGLGGGRFTQAGSVRSRGMDLNIDSYLTSKWTARFEYGLADAEYLVFASGTTNLAGRAPTFAPRHTGSLWTTYQLTKRLAVAGGVRASALSYTSFFNTLAMPGYTLVDGAILYYSKFVDLSATMQNIGNRKWYFNGSVYNTQVYPGTPFGMVVNARFKWAANR
ncbi:MAG: TonB-dependent receptor [Bryobacteraceae bacterium]|nr:TonB-dependent receptor [Bryobacteraceae bacterium]